VAIKLHRSARCVCVAKWKNVGHTESARVIRSLATIARRIAGNPTAGVTDNRSRPSIVLSVRAQLKEDVSAGCEERVGESISLRAREAVIPCPLERLLEAVDNGADTDRGRQVCLEEIAGIDLLCAVGISSGHGGGESRSSLRGNIDVEPGTAGNGGDGDGPVGGRRFATGYGASVS